MAKNVFITWTRDLLVSRKTMWRHFFLFSITFPPVIFANASIMAFLLLHNSTFNFHCYPQCEATPPSEIGPKVTLWPLATSYAKDYKGHSLMQNQLHWTAQYESDIWFKLFKHGLFIQAHQLTIISSSSECLTLNLRDTNKPSKWQNV